MDSSKGAQGAVWVAPADGPGGHTIPAFHCTSTPCKLVLLPADALLMKLVTTAVNTPPIYAGMKLLARQIMINTAEKKGVNWKQNVADLERSEVGSTVH